MIVPVGDRKFVVACASLGATFALGLVLVFVQPPAELVANVCTMWGLTIGICVGAFNIANAVENYSNGKGSNVNNTDPGPTA